MVTCPIIGVRNELNKTTFQQVDVLDFAAPSEDVWSNLVELTNPASDTPYNLEELISKISIVHGNVAELFKAPEACDLDTFYSFRCALKVTVNVLHSNLYVVLFSGSFDVFSISFC